MGLSRRPHRDGRRRRRPSLEKVTASAFALLRAGGSPECGKEASSSLRGTVRYDTNPPPPPSYPRRRRRRRPSFSTSPRVRRSFAGSTRKGSLPTDKGRMQRRGHFSTPKKRERERTDAHRRRPPNSPRGGGQLRPTKGRGGDADDGKEGPGGDPHHRTFFCAPPRNATLSSAELELSCQKRTVLRATEVVRRGQDEASTPNPPHPTLVRMFGYSRPRPRSVHDRLRHPRSGGANTNNKGGDELRRRRWRWSIRGQKRLRPRRG